MISLVLLLVAYSSKAPLKQAEDAVLVDSSGMTIEEVVDTVIREFEKVK